MDIFNNNTKKNIFSLFLVAILLSGTVTVTANTFFPTLSMKKVHAITTDDNYGLEIANDDSNNYYESKDFSNKNDNIECTNFNFNANGLKNDEIPQSLRDLIKTATNQQTQTEEIESEESKDFVSTMTSGNDEKRFNSNNNEDFITICKNNNDNEQPIPTPSAPPIPPTPPEDDNVYVAWSEGRPFDREVFFAVSNDNGQTFSTPENISNNAGDSSELQMVVSDNNVYVVWTDTSNSGDIDNRDIFFTVSNDNGQTFLDTPIDLSNNAGDSANPRMAVSGSNVYVVWIDNSNGGDFDIFFTVSNDNGQTFLDTPIDLSNNTETSANPQMAVSGSNVYVVWIDASNGGDQDVFFTVSNDNGQTFLDTPIDLSNNAGLSFNPQMAISGSNIYVVWVDDSNGGDRDIFFTVSNDNGQTFLDTPIDLSNNAGDSATQQMAVSGSNVYVVWVDTSNGGDLDIFFTVSNNNGQTFLDTPIDLSNNTELSVLPQMIIQ